jgi:hypothetical protein
MCRDVMMGGDGSDGSLVVSVRVSRWREIRVALVGFQGLMLKGASETRKFLIRPLKNNGFKEVAGCKNRVIRCC